MAKKRGRKKAAVTQHKRRRKRKRTLSGSSGNSVTKYVTRATKSGFFAEDISNLVANIGLQMMEGFLMGLGFMAFADTAIKRQAVMYYAARFFLKDKPKSPVVREGLNILRTRFTDAVKGAIMPGITGGVSQIAFSGEVDILEDETGQQYIQQGGQLVPIQKPLSGNELSFAGNDVNFQ